MKARDANARRAGAGRAGVVRRLVMRSARGDKRDRVLGVVPPNARYAMWCRAEVV